MLRNVLTGFEEPAGVEKKKKKKNDKDVWSAAGPRDRYGILKVCI